MSTLRKKKGYKKPVKPKAFVRKRIDVNIWDDYHEDGFVPEGEQQSTHAYIEEGDIETEPQLRFQQRALQYLAKRLRELPAAAALAIEYHERDEWREEHGKPGDWNHSLFTGSQCGPQLKFPHLPHTTREQLVKQAKAAKWEFEGLPFHLYSES